MLEDTNSLDAAHYLNVSVLIRYAAYYFSLHAPLMLV